VCRIGLIWSTWFRLEGDTAKVDNTFQSSVGDSRHHSASEVSRVYRWILALPFAIRIMIHGRCCPLGREHSCVECPGVIGAHTVSNRSTGHQDTAAAA